MEFMEIKENWYALTISILRGCIPETAFELLRSNHPDKVTHCISEEDAEDMKVMKAEGLSYQAIGNIYGVGKYTAYYHIRRGPAWAKEHWAAAKARGG